MLTAPGLTHTISSERFPLEKSGSEETRPSVRMGAIFISYSIICLNHRWIYTQRIAYVPHVSKCGPEPQHHHLIEKKSVLKVTCQASA